MKTQVHDFHIPVMGTGFTIDSPIKIAKFGISSVISIGDDILCETMREYYANLYKFEFTPIKKFDEDFRSRRITAYLDLVQDIVDIETEKLKNTKFQSDSLIDKYFTLLPDAHTLKALYTEMCASDGQKKETLQSQLRDSIQQGDINVNIMTKLDRNNYGKDGQLLPDEFSDACSGLRGYAKSKLKSSGVVFSAGFNRRLYAYMENFDCFYPDENGEIEKKVIMKVSDVRSSMIQGRFLAKKGIWISEHRIESGLNCGGHAFASEGLLLGPILQEFKDRRLELTETFLNLCNSTLKKKDRILFNSAPELLITVQGGIGTGNEQSFLMKHYEVNATGWATPFLLVPEVTTLDFPTRKHLESTTKDDLFLSGNSPLGVPFNTVKATPSEVQREERIEDGKPGSPCPKGYLVSNSEYTKKPICTASITFQKTKLKEINATSTDDKDVVKKIVAKTCLCEDLAAGALIEYGIAHKFSLASAVCAGPNLAYFSKISSLADMVSHIYGRLNLRNETYRPNMFVSELKMYIDYLKKEISDAMPEPTDKNLAYFEAFKNNLHDGISYYKSLVPKLFNETSKYQDTMKSELQTLKEELEQLFTKNGLSPNKPATA